MLVWKQHEAKSRQCKVLPTIQYCGECYSVADNVDSIDIADSVEVYLAQRKVVAALCEDRWVVVDVRDGDGHADVRLSQTFQNIGCNNFYTFVSFFNTFCILEGAK